jgi:hypothetical protein
MPPKLVNESGNIITDQYQILQEAKTYYENLYSKRIPEEFKEFTSKTI